MSSLIYQKMSGGGGGGSDPLASILDKSISGVYTNNDIVDFSGITFKNCRALEGVEMQNATKMSSFQSSIHLAKAIFPKLTSIPSTGFDSCGALAETDFSSVTSVGSNAFQYCDNLESISLPKCTSIGGYAFAFCDGLKELEVGTNNGGVVCTLGSSAFMGASALEVIKVPMALVDSYKAASGWSGKASLIVGV